jgi:hypothetical protein
MYDYLPYLFLYGAMLIIVLTTCREIIGPRVRANTSLVIFLVAYATVYLLAIAFYYPTSGTGTARFLLAHLTPLFFAISYLISRTEIAQARWRLGGVRVGTAHFNGLVLAVLALDVAFRLWPRLMTTYGGF